MVDKAKRPTTGKFQIAAIVLAGEHMGQLQRMWEEFDGPNRWLRWRPDRKLSSNYRELLGQSWESFTGALEAVSTVIGKVPEDVSIKDHTVTYAGLSEGIRIREYAVAFTDPEADPFLDGHFLTDAYTPKRTQGNFHAERITGINEVTFLENHVEALCNG